MITFILLLAVVVLQWKYQFKVDYVKDSSLFLIFFTAKNRERKCIKIKL
mgnify:CR=1 FL=1